MDAKKVDFNECAVGYRKRVGDVQQVLGDRSIDNTMAGAVKKLDDFSEYKKTDKGLLIGDQLNLEAQYNVIATKLSDKNRPVFVPAEGSRLSDVEKTMAELEESESERNVALHAELNRQRKLLKMDRQHKDRDSNLHEWVNKKTEYLNTKEDVRSVGDAQLQLTLLSAYDTEAKDVQAGAFAELKALGDDLESEKYERTNEARAREDAIVECFKTLEGLSAKKREILDDDLAREEYRADIRVKAVAHKQRYEKICEWVSKKEAYLNTRETVEDTPSAAFQVTLLEQYSKENKSFNASHVDGLKKFGAEIRASKYESQFSNWVFEEPQELIDREADVDTKFDGLVVLHDAKKPILADHLAREQHKDRLRIDAKGHSELHQAILQWVADKTVYLNARPDIDSVPEAQLQLSGLANYVSEKQMTTESSVATLKADGAAINADVYKTEFSSYTWEDPKSLADREADIDAKFAELDVLSAKLKTDLDAALAREQEKEKLRLKWTELAGGYQRWLSDKSKTIGASIFGYSLEEVQAYEATMKSDEAALEAASNEKKGVHDATWSEMEGMGIKENIYCKETPATLQAAKVETLDSAVTARQGAYQVELARQVKNDNMCKDYADLVNSFSQWLSAEKDAVSKGQGTKEEQLAKVEALSNDKATQEAKLGPIRAAEAGLEAEGIEQNRHTSLTAKDVEIQYDGFNNLLARKTEMLKDLIELEKLRGVSQEEWEEFNNNFTKFDKNSNDSLEMKEFKALMYSVGEEMTKAQTTEVFNEYADGDRITRARYNDYMVKLAGDSDTRENVTTGFQLLSNGKEYCQKEDLSRIMNPDDVDFIYTTIPSAGEGQDYNAWIEEIYSR
jgi:Ca2+-binding EF-hand superfamily protein